jgi:hypothetical protein
MIEVETFSHQVAISWLALLPTQRAAGAREEWQVGR